LRLRFRGRLQRKFKVNINKRRKGLSRQILFYNNRLVPHCGILYKQL
jgi:hypothetical protein